MREILFVIDLIIDSFMIDVEPSRNFMRILNSNLMGIIKSYTTTVQAVNLAKLDQIAIYAFVHLYDSWREGQTTR